MSPQAWDTALDRYDRGLSSEPFDNQPDPLYPDLTGVWEAFWILNRGRLFDGASGSPMPLPLSEIEAFIRLFPQNDVKTFVGRIYMMDSAYLEAIHDKKKTSSKKEEKRVRPHNNSRIQSSSKG